MLVPVFDLNESLPIDRIPANEPSLPEHFQCCVTVHVVSRENLHADFLGAIGQPAIAVCNGPQPDEQKSDLKRKLDQFVIGEKPWLDVARSSHFEGHPIHHGTPSRFLRSSQNL